MKIQKQLCEVRKFVNSWEGVTEKSYIKYQSTFEILDKSEKAIQVRVTKVSSSLRYQFYPWEQKPDQAYVWTNPLTETKDIWIPLSIITGDPYQEDFTVQDWIVKKKENQILFNLVPYRERGYLHANHYKVYPLEQFEEITAKANAEAKAKKSDT
ncbi:hypothetical protein [Paenibacillus sp. 1A_MP2]|uniref:hypothetical protein n=1 Tax=Paenibacillus sp. 1A_MP2 TaxID=3457495 RepID=UPI003FCEE312